jgi:hypothetical protein
MINCQKKIKATYAMLNNCHSGFAIRYALRLRELMTFL